MGFFDALFNPSKNTKKGYDSAMAQLAAARGQTDPFFQQQVQAGQTANQRLAALLGLSGVGEQQNALDQWQMSPAAAANMRQGIQAIDQSGAARGMSRSGATMKALADFGGDQWNQEYNTFLSQLGSVGQGGYAGASGLTGNATGAGNLAIGRGQAVDAGRQAAFGNVLGIAGTAVGAFTGMPSTGGSTLGRLFSGTTTGQANSQFADFMRRYYGS